MADPKTQSDTNHNSLQKKALEWAILSSTTPLPGCIPYKNRRQTRVRKKYDGFKLASFLSAKFPHIESKYWQESINGGRLLRNGRPLGLDSIVRSGNVLIHVVPNTIEPVVNNRITILHNDPEVIVIDKPAPLPVHPSGRYNKNTLISFLKTVQPALEFHIVHRLDSDTTGIMIVAKTKDAARDLRSQFDTRKIGRSYLALITPIPSKRVFQCSARISAEPSHGGSRRVEKSALSACTNFKVLEPFNDNTALVDISPKSGRTNQIRLHLQHLGYQIVGDPMYTLKGTLPPLLNEPKTTLHLHSSMIRFCHPCSQKMIKLFAPYPNWLNVR